MSFSAGVMAAVSLKESNRKQRKEDREAEAKIVSNQKEYVSTANKELAKMQKEYQEKVYEYKSNDSGSLEIKNAIGANINQTTAQMQGVFNQLEASGVGGAVVGAMRQQYLGNKQPIENLVEMSDGKILPQGYSDAVEAGELTYDNGKVYTKVMTQPKELEAKQDDMGNVTEEITQQEQYRLEEAITAMDYDKVFPAAKADGQRFFNKEGVSIVAKTRQDLDKYSNDPKWTRGTKDKTGTDKVGKVYVSKDGKTREVVTTSAEQKAAIAEGLIEETTKSRDRSLGTGDGGTGSGVSKGQEWVKDETTGKTVLKTNRDIVENPDRYKKINPKKVEGKLRYEVKKLARDMKKDNGKGWEMEKASRNEADFESIANTKDINAKHEFLAKRANAGALETLHEEINTAIDEGAYDGNVYANGVKDFMTKYSGLELDNNMSPENRKAAIERLITEAKVSRGVATYLRAMSGTAASEAEALRTLKSMMGGGYFTDMKVRESVLGGFLETSRADTKRKAKEIYDLGFTATGGRYLFDKNKEEPKAKTKYNDYNEILSKAKEKYPNKTEAEIIKALAKKGITNGN